MRLCTDQPPNTLPVIEVVKQSVILAAVPGFTMLIGGLYPVLANKQPGRQINYALQHLAAGILLCAIAQELVPSLSGARTIHELASIVIGFTLGVVVMVGLKAALGEPDEGDEDEPDGDEGMTLLEAQGHATNTHSGRGDIVDPDDVVRRTPSGANRLSERQPDSSRKKQSYVATAEIKQKSQPFPWTFALCVYIDSAMDGLLIGLTLVTGQSAGLFMAIALCVEMGFLGLTFSISCAGQSFTRKLLANIAGPVFLIIGAAIGGLIANALAVNPAALVGCTSFGTAALLYMVCEELLVAAHESGEEHVWWIDLQVYMGFMFSLILQKAFELSSPPPPSPSPHTTAPVPKIGHYDYAKYTSSFTEFRA